jgi:hypothetical protein
MGAMKELALQIDEAREVVKAECRRVLEQLDRAREAAQNVHDGMHGSERHLEVLCNSLPFEGSVIKVSCEAVLAAVETWQTVVDEAANC